MTQEREKMQELFINVENHSKKILLIENGKLIEKYEEEDGKERMEDNIYLGIVENVLPGMQAAFVDIGKEKNTFIHIRDIIPKASNETGNKNEIFGKYDIKDYLKPGMPIMVQVKKDSTNKKGARISSHISISGRFCVLMPQENFITISQKIDDEQERERLLTILKEVVPEGYGAIVRTSAVSKTKEEIEYDVKKLVNRYEGIQKKFQKAKRVKKPVLLYQSESVIQKTLVDLMDQDLYRIVTNNKATYKEIESFLKQEKVEIQLEMRENLLEFYDLEKQLEEMNNRKIWLKCGGFITIDKTEALTAIDVNSGKYTGKKDLEETIFTVNKEATIEIAKQLRLRDIGGIIIIDYIDMQSKENEEKIIELLREQLRRDRSKTQIVGFSKLNLLEMTRKHMCSND